MLKKLSLSLFLSALPMTICSANVDRIASNQNTLDHISQEKKAVVLKLQNDVIAGKKAIEYMKNVLKEDYENVLMQVNATIKRIAQLAEFIDTVDHVTDYMVTCIVEHHQEYNSITINPDDYPLKDKVDYEVAQAFSPHDGKALQLFNISYVIGANIHGSMMLLKKLALRIEELTAEITALEAADQTISE